MVQALNQRIFPLFEQYCRRSSVLALTEMMRSGSGGKNEGRHWCGLEVISSCRDSWEKGGTEVNDGGNYGEFNIAFGWIIRWIIERIGLKGIIWTPLPLCVQYQMHFQTKSLGQVPWQGSKEVVQKRRYECSLRRPKQRLVKDIKNAGSHSFLSVSVFFILTV